MLDCLTFQVINFTGKKGVYINKIYMYYVFFKIGWTYNNELVINNAILFKVGVFWNLSCISVCPIVLLYNKKQVCVCTHIHAFVHEFVLTYMHLCAWVFNFYKHISAWVQIFVHEFVLTYMSLYSHTWVCTLVRLFVCEFVLIYK